MTFREIAHKLGIWDSLQRKTFRELAALSDEELADVGLNRGDIIRIVNEMPEKRSE